MDSYELGNLNHKLKQLKVKSILVISWFRVGELILSTILLKILKKKFKDARIYFIVGKGGKDLLKYEKSIHRLIESDIYIFRYILKKKFDLTIDLFDSKLSRLVAHFSGSKHLISSKKPYKDSYFKINGHRIRGFPDRNVKEHFLGIVRAALGDEKKFNLIKPALTISKKESLRATSTLRRLGISPRGILVGLQPACKYEFWDPYKFAVLSQMLIDTYGAKVLIFHKSRESAYAKSIYQILSNKSSVILPDLNLRDYLAMIGKCSFFVTTMGGSAHAGPALGIPTFVILSKKRASYWIPPYKESFYIPVLSNGRFRNKESGKKSFDYELMLTPQKVFSIIQSKRSSL